MLGGEVELVGWWLVDPGCGVAVEDLGSGLRAAPESFGVGAAGRVEGGVAVTVDGVSGGTFSGPVFCLVSGCLVFAVPVGFHAVRGLIPDR